MENKTSAYDFTIIVPVYNEEGNMSRLEEALSAFKAQAKVKTCILFVNDGSTDGSGQLMREVCARQPDFFYIEFVHNCGLSAAMKAGIDYACSKWVGYIDADLQTTPEDLPVESASHGLCQADTLLYGNAPLPAGIDSIAGREGKADSRAPFPACCRQIEIPPCQSADRSFQGLLCLPLDAEAVHQLPGWCQQPLISPGSPQGWKSGDLIGQLLRW